MSGVHRQGTKMRDSNHSLDITQAEERFEQWLKAAGFQWNPFENLKAEDDPYLQSHFVVPDFFGEMLGGNPAVLYAPAGGGKTASRRILEALCEQGHPRLPGRVFSVTYDNFERVVEKADRRLDAITARMHIEAILEKALPQLFNHLVESPEQIERFGAVDQAYLREFLNEFTECLTSYHLKDTLEGTGLTKQQIQDALGQGLASEAILGIPSETYATLRKVLLKCGPFSRDDELHNIFTDARISALSADLPQANSRNERVMAVVRFLYQHNIRGENALILFLHVLSEHTDPGDDCSRRLAELANELEKHNTFDNILIGVEEDFHSLIELVARLLEENPDAVSLNRLGATQMLEKFFDLMTAAGFDSMFILVDNVEGLPETSNAPRACLSLLQNLIGRKGFINQGNVYFKFFLPLYLVLYL